MYCIKMERTEPEFWNSTIRKITMLIDMYVDEKSIEAAAVNDGEYESKYFRPEEAKTVTSMREVEGFV